MTVEEKIECDECHEMTPSKDKNGKKKVFCIYCRKRVQHRTHYIWLKRVLNKALKDNTERLELGLFPDNDNDFVKVVFHENEFHIKNITILKYYRNKYTMEELQDGVIKIKKYMT